MIESNPLSVSTVLLFLSTLLVFTDWLLGERHRKILKEKVGMWSLYISEISYQEIVVIYSGILVKKSEAFFGERSVSLKRLLIIFLLSTVLTIFISGIAAFSLASDMTYSPVMEPHFSGYFYFFFLFFSLPMLIPTLLTDWLSFSITLKLLSYVNKKHNAPIYFLVIIIDIILAILLGIFAGLSGSYFFGDVSMYIIQYLDYYDYFPGQWSLYGWMYFLIIAAVTAAIPTFLHSAIIISFIFIKLMSFLWIKPASLILIRFYESPKGVFANIGIAIAVVVVLFKALLKNV